MTTLPAEVRNTLAAAEGISHLVVELDDVNSLFTPPRLDLPNDVVVLTAYPRLSSPAAIVFVLAPRKTPVVATVALADVGIDNVD